MTPLCLKRDIIEHGQQSDGFLSLIVVVICWCQHYKATCPVAEWCKIMFCLQFLNGFAVPVLKASAGTRGVHAHHSRDGDSEGDEGEVLLCASQL